VFRAVHETYRGARDVERYREEMVARYQEELARGEKRESFFPPPTQE
jgi:hypothetical protein